MSISKWCSNSFFAQDFTSQPGLYTAWERDCKKKSGLYQGTENDFNQSDHLLFVLYKCAFSKCWLSLFLLECSTLTWRMSAGKKWKKKGKEEEILPVNGYFIVKKLSFKIWLGHHVPVWFSMSSFRSILQSAQSLYYQADSLFPSHTHILTFLQQHYFFFFFFLLYLSLSASESTCSLNQSPRFSARQAWPTMNPSKSQA